MRRFKISKNILASLSPDFLKKLIENLFDITEENLYAYDTDGQNAYVRVKNDTFRVIPIKTYKRIIRDILYKNTKKIENKNNISKKFIDYLYSHDLNAEQLAEEIIKAQKDAKVYKDVILTKTQKKLDLGINNQYGAQGAGVYNYADKFNERAQVLNNLIDKYNSQPNEQNFSKVKLNCTKLKLFLNEYQAICLKNMEETENQDVKKQDQEILRMIDQSMKQLEVWLNFNYNGILSKIIKENLGIDTSEDNIKITKDYIIVNNRKFKVLQNQQLQNKIKKLQEKYDLPTETIDNIKKDNGLSLNLNNYSNLLSSETKTQLQPFDGKRLIQE